MPKPTSPGVPKGSFPALMTDAVKDLSTHVNSLNKARGKGWALHTRVYRTYGSLSVLHGKLEHGLGFPQSPPRARKMGPHSDDGITAEAYDVSQFVDGAARASSTSPYNPAPGWIPPGTPRIQATKLRTRISFAITP